MRFSYLGLPAACLLLAACGSATLPIRGQSSDGYERFTGTSTGTVETGGTLSLISNRGRSCSGEFYYFAPRQGAGTLTCNDGSSGSFRFIAAGTRGTGTGVLGGRNFTFSFG